MCSCDNERVYGSRDNPCPTPGRQAPRGAHKNVAGGRGRGSAKPPARASHVPFHPAWVPWVAMALVSSATRASHVPLDPRVGPVGGHGPGVVGNASRPRTSPSPRGSLGWSVPWCRLQREPPTYLSVSASIPWVVGAWCRRQRAPHVSRSPRGSLGWSVPGCHLRRVSCTSRSPLGWSAPRCRLQREHPMYLSIPETVAKPLHLRGVRRGCGEIRGALAPGACRCRAGALRLRFWAPLSGLELPRVVSALSRRPWGHR